MIYLVLEWERKSKTPMPTGLKMSWKWADLAVQLQFYRVVNQGDYSKQGVSDDVGGP
ncbi:hypothetical protein DFH07DRAFT_948230 [Mycena maculata]|uniref:Uncharacterized protein n=1 Tax=Mycena maculata TaxID=230809 RepID=A0AAD7KGK4_9AGAR|nr:hypothetical protein DFH07DRAFT_948230 [Mycena maculata]